MGDQFTVLSENDVRTDGAIGTDRASRRYNRRGSHNGCRVNAHSALAAGAEAAACLWRGTSWHMMTASQASLPSTVAVPSMRQAFERQLRTLTSMRDLIAGHNGAAKLGALNAGEEGEVFVTIGKLGEQQARTRLSHCFNHQHSGHDRIAGKVALKKRLIDGDIFNRRRCVPCELPQPRGRSAERGSDGAEST